MNRLYCPACKTTYVFSGEANGRKRLCQRCGSELVNQLPLHPEQIQLNDRERVWSDRLLLSVFPEGVKL